MGWEFTDAEIEAISRYVMEGHGLIATAGTFYYNVPNNNKLAPLFGLNESIMWSAAQTDLLYLLNTTHPLFDNVPNPLVFPQVGTATPYDGQWDLNELINGEYLALGYYQESAVVVRRGLVYISPMLEWIPPHYHHHLQLLYNAITWSRYQKPKHELTVSLEAPEYLEPSESVLLNATVYNGGLSNETNVELQLLINGSIAASTLIPELPTGESYTLSYLWTPMRTGNYNITAYVLPVLGEECLENNIITKRTLVFYYQRLYLPHEWVGGGYSMGWHDDDASWQYTLPFDFPFYGIYYRDIYISSNGLITFIGPDSDFGNSIPDLATKLAIAPAWDDWVTNYPHDIYIWENSTHVGIRWDVQSFDAGVFANFEAILCVDGTIQFNYAFSDGVVSATIGISNGAGHIIAEDATSLNYMNTIIFTPLQPEHELVAQLEAPCFIEPESQVVLNATVLNQGLNNETNIELKLVINGSLVASKIIQELATGASDTLSYLWTPTVKGVYNVTVYVPPKPEEKYTLNNIVTRFVKVAPIRFVLFDQTHWTDAIWDYSLLIANLIERGFIVENHTTGPITPEVLDLMRWLFLRLMSIILRMS